MPAQTGPKPVPPPGVAYPPAGAYPPAAGYGAPAAWGRPAAPGGARVKPLSLIGAVAVAVAALLPWLDAPGPGGAANAFKVPVAFLFDPTGAGTGGLQVGVVLVALGVIGAALTFVPGAKQILRALGGVSVAGAALFAAQVIRLVSELNSQGGSDVNPFTVIGVGVYATVVGGILLATGR
jgi:hypothetical protein